MFLQFQSRVQIFTRSLKLRAPRGERIRFAGIEHVAHGETQRIEIVLQAEKLQRVTAISVHHVALKSAEAGELRAGVKRINEDGGQRKHEAEKQAGGGR